MGANRNQHCTISIITTQWPLVRKLSAYTAN